MKEISIPAIEADVGHEHYDINAVNLINFMFNTMPREQFIGFCKGNITKYIHRYQKKGGVKDLWKAHQYLKWLIDIEWTETTKEPSILTASPTKKEGKDVPREWR